MRSGLSRAHDALAGACRDDSKAGIVLGPRRSERHRRVHAPERENAKGKAEWKALPGSRLTSESGIASTAKGVGAFERVWRQETKTWPCPALAQ